MRARSISQRFVLPFAIIVLSFAGACTALYTTTDDGAPSVDASADTALADGSRADSAPPPDAPLSVNESGAGDAGVDGSFCASLSPPPLYCADYDEVDASADLTGSFTNAPSAGVATIAIDSAHYVSPSSEITCYVSAGATNPTGGRTAGIFRGLTAVTRQAHLQFSVRIDAASDPSTQLLLASVGFGDSGGGTPVYNIALMVGGNTGATIAQQYNGVTQYVSSLTQPKIGAWSLVDLLIDFDTDVMLATVDGAPTKIAMSTPTSGSVSFAFGLAYYATTGSVIATTAHFDNVWFDGN